MNRWDELEALLEEAIELAPAARREFLSGVEARDPELRRELDSLLAVHAEASGYFDGLADRVVTPVFSHLDEAPAPPERVGAYLVEREIGRGGMSTVYLARRADGQFEQEVALKVIRRGGEAPDRIARFLAERRILASLNHPNIAHLYDGGVLPDGRPYFVMEYVEGLPFDRYCDAHRLAIAERLRLFLVVLDAIQYAHRNLIVHRDLKPSNIFVAGDGRVKLLDFGIAKLLDEEQPMATQTGARWMTPEYAAPEQIRGLHITTATDVYQLGVLLYKLLTGHRPYRTPTGSTYEMERAVCEEEPTRPSAILGRTEDERQGEATVRVTPESVAQTRGVALPMLRRTLSGDLDAIILKALRKEPEARYTTAEGFAEDIKRYLTGQPVEARRGSFGYRARKFARRNRWSLAVGALIALLVVGYAVTATIQARRIARAHAQVLTELEKAEKVDEHLINLFTMADANEARSDTLTAREILEDGVERIRIELRDRPEVQAEALTVIGRIYGNLGFYGESVALLDSALALRRQVLGPRHPDVADGLYHLGRALVITGHYDEAAARLQQALGIWEALPGFERQHARSMATLGRLHIYQGDLVAAETRYHEALAIQRQALGAEHEEVARTLGSLALLMQHKGDYAAAESLYQQVLDMQRQWFGERHPVVAMTLSNFAALHTDRGHYAPADSLYQEVLAVQHYLYGRTHHEVAKTLNNLGQLHQAAGHLEAANRYLREALAIKQALLRSDHPSLSFTYFNLGGIAQRLGDYAAAESLYTRALTIDRKAYGGDHAEIAVDLNALGELYHEQGDLERARQFFTEALAMQRRARSAGPIPLSTTLLRYGRLLIDLGRAEEAEPMLYEALDIRTDVLTEAHWGVAEVRGTIGACLGMLGRYEEGEHLLRRSVEALAAEFGATHYRTERARRDLAALYDAWEKRAAAVR